MLIKKLLLTAFLVSAGSVSLALANSETAYLVTVEYIDKMGQKGRITQVFGPDSATAQKQALVFCEQKGFTNAEIIAVKQGYQTQTGLVFEA